MAIQINPPTRKSKRLMDIQLFQRLNNIRAEHIAGFRVWLDQKNDSLHHSSDDWKKLYKEYQER